jgi:hypothetical protein
MFLETLTALYIGFNTLPYVGSKISINGGTMDVSFDTKIHLDAFNVNCMGFSPKSALFTADFKYKFNIDLFVGYEHVCSHSFDNKQKDDRIFYQDKKYFSGIKHKIYFQLNQ